MASAHSVTEKKCSGDVPRCSNCQLNSLACTYGQPRRHHLEEFVRPYSSFSIFPLSKTSRAKHLNHTLTVLLRDLSGRVANEDKQRIEEALDEVRSYVSLLNMLRAEFD
jgi:hypothetical protein